MPVGCLTIEEEERETWTAGSLRMPADRGAERFFGKPVSEISAALRFFKLASCLAWFSRKRGFGWMTVCLGLVNT